MLKVKELSKKYALTKALDNVSFEIKRGEIHALCGENGAGKSTLIKLLTGAIEPSKGSIEFCGKEYKKLSPKLSFQLGITAIYQEFSLIPYLSVVENIFFGREIKKYGLLNKDKMRQETELLCDSMEINLDVNAKISELGVAQQQIVEILKAVSRDAQFIIMDEPTAPLTINETEVFFNIIKKLKSNNKTILFISHKLEEVFEICDRVTVLCDGKFVITQNVDSLDRRQLIYYMVGRNLSETYPSHKTSFEESLFSANEITNKSLTNINFELRKGEILGFGGLVGAGRTELMRAIFGVDKVQEGSFLLNNKKYSPNSPTDALKAGIGLIPEDRKNQGIIQDLSVKENIIYASLKKYTKNGVIFSKKTEKISKEYISNLDISTPNNKQKVKNLSGGNQQKVVIAKFLATNCDILIFDEPTRGIDVAAKQEIYKLMVDLVSSGKSIIMVSSEMPELMGMSDRIIVMSNGKIIEELERANFSQEKILELASRKI